MNYNASINVKTINALIVEDSEDDAILLVDYLSDAGYLVNWNRVYSSDTLIDALSSPWDIVFSDYSMPNFNGEQALQIVRKYDELLPMIFVSGTIAAEAAVRAMKMGAQDYVIKNDLNRLIPAVERELKEAQLHRRHKQNEERIRQLSKAVNQAGDSILITDANRIIEYVNPAFEAMLGYQSADVLGRPAETILSSEKNNDVKAKIHHSLLNGEVFRGTVVNQHKDGHLVYEEQVIAPLKDYTGTITHYVSTGRDITDRIMAEASRKRLAAIIEATPDVVVIFDHEGHIRHLNIAARKILGWEKGDGINLCHFKLQDLFFDNTVELLKNEVLPQLPAQGTWSGETRLKIDQQTRDIAVSIVVLNHVDEGQHYYSAIARDLSSQKELEEQLKHKANYDGLTDLPNRFLLLDRLQQAIPRAKRSGKHIGVLFLDMDNFKRVNDNLGHDVGDQLLQQVANRFRQNLRPNDTVARHGGDEFTIIVEDLNQPDNAVAILRNFRRAFEDPIIIDNHEIFVSFSTGIAIYPDDSDNIEDLLRFADTAMYRAKAGIGSNRYSFYLPDMNEHGDDVLSMEADLWRALERKEFELYYQPQVDVESGKIIAAESLIRWNHHQKGLIPPDQFIYLLENTGLIITVGEWILSSACRMQRLMGDLGYPDFRISVNISTVQFSDHAFLSKVIQIVRDEGVKPCNIELEITEQIAMQDPQYAAEILQELNHFGLRCAIDDFGTGYSSLAYLKRFPIDVLKIDKTFISELEDDVNDTAIVEASISMAQKLGLETVAEGVETQAQYDFLKQRGCLLAQGYFFDKPLPEKQFIKGINKTWK